MIKMTSAIADNFTSFVKKWCDEGLLSHLEQGKYRKN